MNIIPIKYGESVLSESMIFKNGSPEKFRHIDFIIYLIKHNQKYILADAGCETMPGFEMHNFIGPVKALENEGITPEMITDVIITHAHHDHIECTKYFTNANIHIQEIEYENGKSYIPKHFHVNTFDKEYALCSHIQIIKIGGHSVGSCIVKIDCNGKKFIIVGDECYLRECIDRKIPTGASYNTENSEKFIEEYSKSKYNILLCHDK